MSRWVSLLVCLGVCYGVSGVGAHWTAAEIPAWYRGLAKPPYNPPNWIFAPVWTLLYGMMAVAAWRVWLAAPSPQRTWGLGLFLLQLGLNLMWTWVFFVRHSLAGGVAEVAFLWIAIGATTLVFYRAEPAAAYLMAPYWTWVSFAALLNVGIWRRN
jgi:tryptophan-rich sensory protein